jgi:hypothetical protein
VVADVAQNVMEIFPTSEGVYGLTTRDAAFRVLPATDGGPGLVKMVSDIPRDNPHRLVVRGGKPVWISFLTLVGADEDGGHRQTLAKDVWSAAVGPRALYFSATEGLYAIDWPASTSARLVAPVGVQSTELVVADPWILGRSQTTGMWAYNLDTGKPHDFDPCPDRKCRGGVRDLSLSADRTAVSWHEGPADIIPGPDSRAYRLSLTSWTVSVLSQDQDPDFLVDARCMFGGGKVRDLNQAQWINVTPIWGGSRPVVNNRTEWFWTQPLDPNGDQIVSAPMALCCDQALKGPH